MPQPSKIPLAFAASGDKNTIPESTETTGLASWRDGFPAITSVPFSEGGIAPKRADFNGIFNALSAAALWYQQGGVFVYDNATNYEIGNIVIYSGEIYVCKTANGPASALHSPANDTTETYWGRIYPQNGTFDRMYFSQTSGTYTAPRTGVYRITLKGGGGGGAGARTSPRGGSGGGEGGTLIMYRTLIKAASYAYVIGAGGTGGINAETGSSGSAGGTTSITIDGTTYSAFGGGGAVTPGGSSAPGAGGTASSVSNAIAIPGAPGQPGAFFATPNTALYAISGGGGGSGGGNATMSTETLAAGVMGGGGAGSAVYNGAVRGGANGGTGYILIEYAG